MTRNYFTFGFRGARAASTPLARMIAKIQFGFRAIVAAIGSVGEADRRMSAFCQLDDAALNDIGVNRLGWRS